MINLTLIETRVIGCLIEKAATTPDQYPLSLNGLTGACNQKSNRDPVLDLDEAEVQAALDSLISHNMAAEVRVGSRVAKYEYRIGVSEFSDLKFNKRELALLCLLFVRGPQTSGELRGRSARLADFKDIAEVESALIDLSEKESGACVLKLPREPGKRESKWAHLFSGEIEVSENEPAIVSQSSGSGETLTSRVDSLENELDSLKKEVAELKSLLDDLTS